MWPTGPHWCQWDHLVVFIITKNMNLQEICRSKVSISSAQLMFLGHLIPKPKHRNNLGLYWILVFISWYTLPFPQKWTAAIDFLKLHPLELWGGFHSASIRFLGFSLLLSPPIEALLDRNALILCLLVSTVQDPSLSCPCTVFPVWPASSIRLSSLSCPTLRFLTLLAVASPLVLAGVFGPFPPCWAGLLLPLLCFGIGANLHKLIHCSSCTDLDLVPSVALMLGGSILLNH